MNRIQHVDYFNELDDRDFKKRFRLSKESVLELCNSIADHIKAPTTR